MAGIFLNGIVANPIRQQDFLLEIEAISAASVAY
jgi:hypothetical protein